MKTIKTIQAHLKSIINPKTVKEQLIFKSTFGGFIHAQKKEKTQELNDGCPSKFYLQRAFLKTDIGTVATGWTVKADWIMNVEHIHEDKTANWKLPIELNKKGLAYHGSVDKMESFLIGKGHSCAIIWVQGELTFFILEGEQSANWKKSVNTDNIWYSALQGAGYTRSKEDMKNKRELITFKSAYNESPQALGMFLMKGIVPNYETEGSSQANWMERYNELPNLKGYKDTRVFSYIEIDESLISSARKQVKGTVQDVYSEVTLNY